MKPMNNRETVPVLVLSAHTIALGVVRSLGPQGVPLYLVSYDRKDMAHKSRYVKECFFLPHPENHAAAFVTGLLDIGRRIGRAVVFAADDPTLTTLAKNRNILEKAFIIPTPDWSVIQNVINKNITYSLAERAGIPVPKTRLLDGSSPLTPALIQDFRFPCLIKPVQSHTYYAAFKTKMTVVTDFEELQAGLNACRAKGIDVTLQEIIPGDAGQGLNFNSLFYDGKIRAGFTACKVRMTDNGYGIPTVVRSREMINELWSYSEKLLQAAGYEGYSCIEYKFDQRDGLYKLLEINGRYNRSSLLSVKSGLNFPWIEYNRLVHGREAAPDPYQENIYYIDEFKDLQVNIKDLLRGKLNVWSFFRPYFSRRIFAVFSLRDPAPFLRHAFDGIAMRGGGKDRHSLAESAAAVTTKEA